MASAAVAAVVVADGGWRMVDLGWFAFVGYSLLIWAVLPVLVTLAITFLITLVTDVELPMWFTAGVAALATGSWMGWGAGVEHGGVAYGVVVAAGIFGVGLILDTHRRLRARVLLAALVAAATAVLAFVGFDVL
ncbi:hypothetical protein [Isoptericola sp. BMS4]|uniref:hypothetical protein n=1 Tax=Isoptericola sp. BMS4 TaxID=2527875 RepID=UPI0014211E7E|nr:hypothetical protein [Isoptericola sp. BMS4]